MVHLPPSPILKDFPITVIDEGEGCSDDDDDDDDDDDHEDQ